MAFHIKTPYWKIIYLKFLIQLLKDCEKNTAIFNIKLKIILNENLNKNENIY